MKLLEEYNMYVFSATSTGDRPRGEESRIEKLAGHCCREEEALVENEQEIREDGLGDSWRPDTFIKG